jgi:predicted TIM-barrel fold metal-dependent hydrolase
LEGELCKQRLGLRLRMSVLVVLSAVAGCRPTPSSAPPVQKPPAPPPPFVRSDIPRIDMHAHIVLGAALRTARLLDQYGIVHAVNLSGPPPDLSLDDFLVDSDVAYKRITVFTNLNWSYCEAPGYGARFAADLERAKTLGARGLKIPKGLGLGFSGPDGKLLAVDDPGLDAVFEKAGELGMPVAMHIGDPQAFWLPPDEHNERREELAAHPEWSFYPEFKRGEIPSWQALYDAFLRRVARHPKTLFIGVHFGNAPENPELVARALDTYPNLYIDTAARLPAIGRHDELHSAEKLRAFFIKYQDRILFGTDTGVGRRPQDLMLGSSGLLPPTAADTDRFFESSWRYFETDDRDIPSPTPIQGRWNIEGIKLPRPVLEKIYYKNAQRLLGITIPATPLPKQEPNVHPGRLEDL